MAEETDGTINLNVESNISKVADDSIKSLKGLREKTIPLLFSEARRNNSYSKTKS